MSTKIDVEVVCEKHPAEKLDTVSEQGGNYYDFRLRVEPCEQCLADAVSNAEPEELPARSAELIFNESNFTSQTIEV